MLNHGHRSEIVFNINGKNYEKYSELVKITYQRHPSAYAMVQCITYDPPAESKSGAQHGVIKFN